MNPLQLRLTRCTVLAAALIGLAGCLDDIKESARGALPFLPPSKYINRGGRKLTRAEAAYYQKLTDYSKQTKINPHDAVAYNAIGELLMKKGSYMLARRCFEDSISFDPNLSEPHHNLGRFFLAEERYSVAVEELKRAMELSGDDAKIRTRLGQAHAGMNHAGEALAEFDRAIAIDDLYTPAYLEKARVLYAQHNFAQAAETCRTALAHIPPPDPIIALRAKQTNIGLLDKLLPGQTIVEDDTPPPTYKEEAAYDLALCLKAQGSYGEALSALAGAETAADGRADIQLLKAGLQDLQGDTGGALATLTLLRTAQPNLAVVSKQIARLQEKSGQSELAAKTRLEAAELDQSDKDLQEEAVRDAERKGNKARIIQLYERLARIEPGNLRYRLQLAQAYDQAGIFREAALAWQEVLTARDRVRERTRAGGDPNAEADPMMLNPPEQTIRRRCGMLCSDIPGMQNKALFHFKVTLQLTPDDAEVHRRMGELYLQTRNFPEAERHIRETLRIAPQDAKSHHNLATLQAEKKQFDDAVAEYRKAIQIDPKLEISYLNVAQVLLGQNRREEALEPLTAYVKMKPLSIDAHRMLADLYRDLNNKPAALAELEAVYALEVENGGNLEDLLKTVEIEWSMGEKKRSISDLEAQIEKHPSEVKLLVAAGRYYSQSKLHYRSVYTWERVLNVAGNNEDYKKDRAEALTQLSLEYDQIGRLDDAIKMSELAGRDHDPEGWRRAAELQLKKALPLKATEAYRQVLVLKDKDADARRQLAMLLQSSPKAAEREEALKLYQEYLVLLPKDEAARVNFANLLAEFSHFSEAQEQYNMLLKDNPKSTAALVGRGALFRRRGKYDEALADYFKAAELDPKLAKAYFNAALVYDYYKHDPEKAKEYYQKFVDAGGDPAKLPKDEPPASAQTAPRKPGPVAKKPAIPAEKLDDPQPVSTRAQPRPGVANETTTTNVNAK